MSKVRIFPHSTVDEFIRRHGYTRKEFAGRCRVSIATLYKARALDPERGRIHWTSLVLIAVHMGLIQYGESVGPDHPVIIAIAGGLVGAKGRRAAQFEDGYLRVRRRHLRVVS